MKKAPFLYRSFFNFWLVYILPASILTILITELFKGSISWELLKLPSTYVRTLIFQVLFGLWMYYRDYKPKAKRYKEES
ncbi:hypothetical protein LZF95_11940 [Algoriphagus sp. AGSA1]|uniref:hypothetical protein n=1 Tax=Algoriphagus sp. AGSA1 TaxID=2907213 RepID=UPI001F3DF987|nr:hypothetical protein [Algoriphagus sp. AGSA1]MCE7055388.1 hypothetical protein [Algoriphagus sp. AGSA1]